MNHTYRLIWNRALAMFVAVAECARAMGKTGGGKAIAAVALAAAVIASPAALAHTTSVGYVVMPGNAVEFWYGTYHTVKDTTYTEGSLKLVGSNGYTATVSFTDLVYAKPAGLVDGVTNFYSDGTQLVATSTRVFHAWQGVEFADLRPGSYTFTYLAAATPTVVWDPIDSVINSNTFFIYTDTVDRVQPTYLTSVMLPSGPLKFSGGTLTTEVALPTIEQAFSIDANGGTIDQAGNTTTFTGVIADQAAGVPGALNVINSGTGGKVVLTAADTYTGATTIAAGATLSLEGAGSIASSAGVVDNGVLNIASTAPAALTSLAGTGTVNLANQALTITNGASEFSGVIAGTGNVTVSGGVQALTGANTMAGTVSATNGGTLRIGSDASLGAAANALVLDNGTLNTTATTTIARAVTISGQGTLQTDAGTTLTSHGAVSGSGTLVKSGDGTLVLGGDSSGLTGGATVNGGTLTLASTSGVGSGALTLNAGILQTAIDVALAQKVTVAAGTSIVTAAGTTATLSGTVSSGAGGSGCFVKSGGGTLTLAGAGTYNMGVCVQQGMLRANGLMDATFVTVAAGATLRGSGTINGPVTVSGTLAPGNSPGTLTTSATVTMLSGSTYQEDINGTGTGSGPGNYSRLLVTGAGQFNAGGATLVPNLVNITGADTYTAYVPKVGDTFRIVSATGGLVGQFATLVQPAGLAAGTTLGVFYDVDSSHSIDLRVLPTSYTTFSVTGGANSNAQASGTSLDHIMQADQNGTATPEQARLGYAVSNFAGGSVVAVTQNLSGEVHAAMAAAAPLAGQAVQGAITGQLDEAAPAGGDLTARSALWADLAANRAAWDHDAHASSFVANRGQLTIGVDAWRNDAGRVGVGFSHARANLASDAGSGTLQENMAFVYGAHQGPVLGVDAIAGAGRTAWETERANPLAGGALVTDMNGRNALASIGLSAPWQGETSTFKPYVRVLWQRVARDAGDEGMAVAALALDQFSASGTRTTTGLAGTTGGGLFGTMQFNVGIGRDNGSLARPTVDSSIAGIASTIVAPHASRTFEQAAISGMVEHSPNAYSYYGIATELHSGRSDVSVTGGLRYVF